MKNIPETTLDGIKVNYDIRESKDASVPRIDFNRGDIKVVVPENVDRDPDAMLQEKKNWVLKQKQDFNQFKRRIPERKFREGEKFPFLGEEYEVVIDGTGQEIQDKIILSKIKVENKGFKSALIDFYREKAKEVFPEKVERYQNQVDGEPGSIYIRNQKTRWGSCSDKQNLNFNWRLLMAPENVVDYVVVHELTHLDIKSHKKEFWKKVREIYPEYKESNRWLQKNSPKLVLEKEDLN